MNIIKHIKIKKGIALLLITGIMFNCTYAECSELGSEIATAFAEILVESITDSIQYRYPVNEKFRQKIIVKVINKEAKAYIKQIKA